MFTFVCSSWQKIKKKFNKLLPLFLCPVLFFCTSLSTFAADSPFFLDGMYNYSFNGQKGNFKFYNPSGSVVVSGDGNIYTYDPLGVIAETPNTSNISNVSRMQYGIIDGYTYPLIIPNLSDYKFLVMVYRGNITSSSFTFIPSSMSIYTNDANSVNEVILDNFDSVNFQTGLSGQPSTIGYIYYGDIPSSFNSSIINGFNLYSDVGGIFPIKANVLMYLYNNVNDDFDDNFNSIVNAINNLTDVFINGDGDTGIIVGGAEQSKNELDLIVEEYNRIEQSMLEDFTSYQDTVMTDFTGWSWAGLSTCANWVGDTMTSYFNNMGDFKQYIIYPLLLGIALFFIGRGSSIIGHLYRKPTVVHTDTVVTRTTTKNGSSSNTVSHTDTFRQGGVLRK